jgi:hypothetical protein
MRCASKLSAPTTPRGSKTAHADILIILSSYLGIAWSVGLS